MHTGQLSDEVLAARVAQGDRTAFETLYDRHASMVLGITFRITGERSVAEDILQETFWRMWQSAASYQPERGPITDWLFRIARNLAIDTYQRRNPKVITDVTADANPILDRMPDPDIDIPKRVRSNLKSQQMQNALKTLPREQRQVIEMAYFYGMTRQEIVEETGEPLDAIHNRARLGLQKLREELEKMKLEF